jgi:hypothetical protein
MSWYAFDDGRTVGQTGSEGGVIVRDEEHGDGARITLERNGSIAPYAITCGIYGWMVHTRFFRLESDGRTEFEEMREEMTRIVAQIPLATDPDVDARMRLVEQAISQFVDRFP